MTIIDVIIVGAGPAGIGIASLLNQTNIDYKILEKDEIGASFQQWPKNMEMITPSFPSNAFGQIDLNSICETTSPAFSFNKEHLNGDEYSEYLSAVADYFILNGQTYTEVKKVYKKNNGWLLETSQGQFFCTYLIWAAGEFQNPSYNQIIHSNHCIHSSKIKKPQKLDGNEFTVIGGYESGVQIAHELIKAGKNVTLINLRRVDQKNTSDPSKVLSPYTTARYNEFKDSPLFTEIIAEVKEISKNNEEYSIHLKNNSTLKSKLKPICATGFSIVKGPIEEFITYCDNGSPKLVKESDEFIGQKNIYLAGPSVRHDDHIFCFIYKFRQRFGVIVEDIMRKENVEEEQISKLIQKWKSNGMYLSDLSCCDTECVC